LQLQQVLAQVLGLSDQALPLGQERIHSAGKTAFKDLGELVEQGPHRLQLLPGCCQFPLQRIPLPAPLVGIKNPLHLRGRRLPGRRRGNGVVGTPGHGGCVRRKTGEIFATLRPPPG